MIDFKPTRSNIIPVQNFMKPNKKLIEQAQTFAKDLDLIFGSQEHEDRVITELCSLLDKVNQLKELTDTHSTLLVALDRNRIERDELKQLNKRLAMQLEEVSNTDETFQVLRDYEELNHGVLIGNSQLRQVQTNLTEDNSCLEF